MRARVYSRFISLFSPFRSRAMVSDRNRLSYYGRTLKAKPLPVSCPRCRASVSPRDFESHCASDHGLDPKLCCVWCFGDREWKAGEKCRNASHLLKCFGKFYDSNKIVDAEADGTRRPDELAGYRNEVERSRRRFLCPTCGVPLLPRDFEEHCLRNHGLDPKTRCVWCLGSVTWSPGEKNLNADHLTRCFRGFVALRRPVAGGGGGTNAVSNRLELLNTEPLCTPRQFFGHEDPRAGLPPEAFEHFEILDHGSVVDYFADENLNAAASYVRLYCETRDTSDWIHVMVKASAFKSFVDAIRKDGGETKILPFSCWCDGGDGRRAARHRQHRHMVVVSSPKGRFRDSVWVDVRGDRPFPNFQAKGMQRVASPIHLANTLGYLCKRESRCSFRVGVKKGPLKNKHFYVFESLPVDYLLPLSVQWEGGMKAMLHQSKYQNVSASRLMGSGTLLFRDRRWKQKIKDFYGFEGGKVLPVKRRFFPSASGGSGRCHLMNGKRLRFELSEENEPLDDESWLRRQAEGGNCFCEAVGDELWTFRHRDQEKLNLAMPLFERCAELESKIDRLEKENESKIDRLENENKLKNDAIRQKDDAIKRLECEIKSKDREIANLKRPPPLTINNTTINNKDCKYCTTNTNR